MLGITWYRDPSQMDPLDTYVRFYFGMKGGRVLPLRLKIQYEGEDWLFTKDLLFKVNGRLFHLSPRWTEWNRENYGSTVYESIDLPTFVLPPLATALANAKSVKLRFSGKRIHDYELPDEEVAALRRVYWIWRATRSPSDKGARDQARVVVKSYLEDKRARDAEKRAQEPRAIVESILEENPKEQAAQPQDERDRVADPFAQDNQDEPAIKLITLSQSDIVIAMRGVQPKIQACANQFRVTGTAMANISVASGGKVTSATVTGKFSSTPTGSCVETAAKLAVFPPCMPTTFPWPFTLSPR